MPQQTVKKTKIIATIGPASQQKEILKKIFPGGVDLARLNTKHNTEEWHLKTAQKISRVSKELDLSIGTIVDLQGPEIRIDPFDDGFINLEKGQELVFATSKNKKAEIVINNKAIIKSFKKGQHFSIDDGRFSFEVIKSKGNSFIAKSLSQGQLKSQKSVNVPFLDVPLACLTKRDKKFLKVLAQEIDYVALSFVRSAEDVMCLRGELNKINPEIGIISKIEKPEAILSIDKIIEASDAIMIARGDLAVEAGFEKIPVLQKDLIRKVRRAGKPVIVATQMLESMISSPIPTRAEVSDVATAVYDRADAVMLSAETATGSYPIEAVEMMNSVIKEVEKEAVFDSQILKERKFELAENSVVRLAALLPRLVEESSLPKGYIVFTRSGRTAQALSALRPLIPTFAFTEKQTVADKLLLSYNVFPFKIKFRGKGQALDMIKECNEILKKDKLVAKGDKVVVVSGDNIGIEGRTNNVRVSSVE